jgi:hypothetical protein
MGRTARACLVAAVGATLLALPAAPAHAAPIPQVGDCYLLDDDQLNEVGWWPDAPAVPCTQEHTFEVTKTGPLPADVNAFEFAERQCSDLDAWAALGVNRPVSGIVPRPLRIVSRAFAVRDARGPYVCGAVVPVFNGSDAPTYTTLDSPFDGLSRRDLFDLRFCADAEDGRRALAPAVSVPCSSRPRWEVSSWVVWTAFYDAFPGRPALRERARELCGQSRAVSVPSRADWDEGWPVTRCYLKRA